MRKFCLSILIPFLFLLVGFSTVAQTVTSITRADPDPTNASTVNFTVLFQSATSGVQVGNFALNAAARVAGTIETPTTSDDITWNVPVSGVTGDGTLSINFVSDMEAPTTANFATGETYLVDNTAPTFDGSNSTPNDDATGVDTAADIVVDFDEDIVVGTGNVTIRDVTGMSDFEVFDITGASTTNSPADGEIGILDDKIYINPTTPLAEATNYAIRIDGSAIDDLGGNSFGGIADNTTFNFTTVDATAPTFVDATFYDTDSNGSVDEILLEFSEDIDESSVDDADFNIGGAGLGSVSFSVTAGTSANNGVDSNDNDVYVTLAVTITGTSDQTISYTQGGLADEAGNLAVTNASLTTIDLAPPSIISATTADVAGMSGEIDQITLLFSEDIDGATLDTNGGSDDFTVRDGGYTYTVLRVAEDGANGAILTLTERGSPDTGVTPNINLGVGDIEDLASNSITSVQNFTSTTDEAPPVIYSSLLQSSNAYLQIVFSEDISSVGGGNIQLTDFNDNTTRKSGASPTVLEFSSVTTFAGDDLSALEDTLLFVVNIDPVPGTYGGDDELAISTNGTTIEDAAGNRLAGSETAGPYTVNDVTDLPSIIDASYTRINATSGYITLTFNEGLFHKDVTPVRSPMLASTNINGTIKPDKYTNGTSDCDNLALCITYTANGGATINDDNNTDIEWRKNNGTLLARTANYANNIYRIYFQDLPDGQFRGNEMYRFKARTGNHIRGRNSDAYMPANYFYDFTFPDLFENPISDASAFAFAYDTDGDGNIDEIVVTFPDEIDDATLAASLADFAISGGSNDGVTPSSIVVAPMNMSDPGVAGDNMITLGFTSYVGSGTARSSLNFTTGNLTDDAANNFGGGSITITDEAKPVIVSARTLDTNANDQIDAITVTFSESFVDNSIDATDFSLTDGYTINGFSVSSPDVTLTLDESGSSDIYLTPPGVNVDVANILRDASGLRNPIQVFTNTSDGVAPITTVNSTSQGSTPNLDGTINDPTAKILINVSGGSPSESYTRPATNDGSGAWTFTNNGIAPDGFTLGSIGSYEVTVIAIDLSGNTGQDATNNELTIMGGATITPATPPSMCVADGYVPLGEIRIQETANDDFGSAGGILLTLPQGFEFNTAATPLFTDTRLVDFTASGTYIGTELFRINIEAPVTSTSLDDLVINGLEVKVITGGSSGSLERTGGTAGLLTTATEYAMLTSSTSPVNPTVVNGLTGETITSLHLRPGDEFELDIMVMGASFKDNWEIGGVAYTERDPGGVSGVTHMGLNNLPGFNNSVVGIYEMKATTSDGGVCPGAIDFLIGVFNIGTYREFDSMESFKNQEANRLLANEFTQDDPTVTIAVDVPTGFIPSFAGPGLGVLNYSDDTATIPFTAVAAGVGDHPITYTLEKDDGSGTVFSHTETYRVSAATTNIFENMVETSLCVGGGFTTFNAKVDDLEAADLVFLEFGCQGCPPNTLIKPMSYTPPTMNAEGFFQSGNHATVDMLEPWGFNPEGVGSFIIQRVVGRVGSNVKLVAGQVGLTVNPVPRVQLHIIDSDENSISALCENDGSVTLEIIIEGGDDLMPVPVSGYEIRRSSDPVTGYIPIITSALNPSDPLGDGTAVGEYEVQYTSNPDDDPSGNNCSVVVSTKIKVQATPSKPTLRDDDLAGIGFLDGDEYMLEFCSGDVLPDLVANSNDLSDMITWYSDAAGENVMLDGDIVQNEFAWSTSIFGRNTFNTAQAIDLYFSATNSAGCESALRKVNIEIYEPLVVELDIASPISANLVNGIYYFEYCADAGVIASYDNVVFASTLPDNESYFTIYNEAKEPIDTIKHGDTEAGGFDPVGHLGYDFTAAASFASSDVTKREYTFYVSQTVSDNTRAGEIVAEFTGCTGATTQVNYTIYTNPDTPAGPDFNKATFFDQGGDQIYDYYMCAGDPLPTISIERVPIEVGNNNYEYQWYDNNMIPFEVANHFGARVDENDLLLGGGVSDFNPNVVGDYVFHVELTTNFNFQSEYAGCVSKKRRQVVIHVYDDVQEPQVTAPGGTTTSRDGVESTVDLVVDYCDRDFMASDVFTASSSYGGSNSSYFRWYEYDVDNSRKDFEILSPGGAASISTADLGLTTLTLPATRYYLVTEVTDVVDDDVVNEHGVSVPEGVIFNDLDNAFSGCESDGTLIQVNVNPIPVLSTNIADDGTQTYCTSDDDITLDLQADGSSAGDVNVSYSVTSSLVESPDDITYQSPQSPPSPPLTGNPTINVQEWHQRAGGNAPDGFGSIIGGASTLHEIEMTYTNPMTRCVQTKITEFVIHPRPAIDVTFITASKPVDGDDLNADNQEFCYDEGEIRIDGFEVLPGGEFELLSEQGIISAGNRSIDRGTNNNIITLSAAALHGDDPFLPREAYAVIFEYMDDNGCQNEVSKTIFINPRPEIVGPKGSQIMTSVACESSALKLFVEMADDKDDYEFEWFVDGTSTQIRAGTIGGDTLVHTLESSNSVDVQVFVTYSGDTFNTSCGVETDRQTITIGETPIPSIQWVGTTANHPLGTNFRISEDNLDLIDTDVDYVEFSINDNTVFMVDDPNNIRFPIEIDHLPGAGYEFNTAGVYSLKVVIGTKDGCSVDVTRNIEIISHLPGITSYTEDFESGAGGWSFETMSLDGKADDLVTSWEIGTNVPDLTSGNTYDGSTAIYTNVYQSGEKSFVYSPSFDLRALNAPAISFLRYENFDSFRDGVVFQMSVDDGRTWVNVGGFNDRQPDGLKSTPGWYNREAITGAPGRDSPGADLSTAENPDGFGWALNSDWKLATSPLAIPDDEEQYVRFRFALGAQLGEQQSDGFGFDLVQLYERETVVLVEQFSSTLSQKSRSANETVDKESIFNGNDVVRINYFTDFTNNGNDLDQLNQRNTSGPGAKSSFYGIEDVPAITISGTPELVTNNSQLRQEGSIQAQIANAKLINPGFDIVINASIDGSNNLTVGADFEARSDILDPQTKLGLFLAILEPQIIIDNSIGPIGLYQVDDIITNVLRKMLPDPAGQFEQGAVATSDVLSIAPISWPISNMFDADTLTVVAYVQNLATKQVLQSSVLGLSNNSNLALGLDDQFDFPLLYPNPTDRQVTMKFAKNGIAEDTKWIIFDQAGREVLKGEIPKGTRTMAVQTSDMLSGLYFIHLYAEDRKRQTKRMMVIH